MAPEKSPAFQFYPNDFLMDGKVAGMSLQERGAYITLLCICWKECSLPNDPVRLARMIGVPAPVFRKLWPALAPCFQVVYGDQLVQPRIERERKKQETYRAMKASAGKLGGRPKAEVIPCLSTTKAEVVAEQSPPSSSSSSFPTVVRTNTDPGNSTQAVLLKIQEEETRSRRAFR